MAYNPMEALEALNKKYGVTTQTAPVTQQPKKAAASQLDKLTALNKKYNVPGIEDQMRATGYLTDTPVGNTRKVQRTTRTSADLRKQLDGINTKIAEFQAKAKEAENDEWLASISHITFNDPTYTLDEAKSRRSAALAAVSAYQRQRDTVAAQLDDTIYNEYMELAKDPHFAELSRYRTTRTGKPENDKLIGSAGYVSEAFADPLYDYINGNKEAEGFIAIQESKTGAKAKGFDKTKYSQMTADEVAVYNYLYSQNKERADEFLKAMEKKLSTRQGAAEAARIDAEPNALKRGAAKIITAGQSGLDSSMQGLAQAMTDEVLPKSQLSYTGAAVKETTSGLGRLAYDSVELVSHMLPSILTSYAIGGAGGAIATTAKGVKTVRNMGQIASSLVTAVSAAGNSYAEQMEKGLTKKQSKTIAALTGASEGGLQYLLSGISAMGGKATNNILSNKIAGIGNGLARVGAKFVASGIGEATEEVLQLFVEPAIIAAVTGEAYQAPEVEEIIYTALLSAISAGFFEGSEIIVRDEASLRAAGRVVLATDSVRAVIDAAANSDNPSMQRLAKKLDKKLSEGKSKKISAYDLGRAMAESANANVAPEETADTLTAVEAPVAVGETTSPAEQATPTKQVPLETKAETTFAADGTPIVKMPQVIRRDQLATPAEPIEIEDPYPGVATHSPAGHRYTELERSGIATGASQEMIDTVKRLANLTKRRVLFYDGNTKTGDWARANGAYTADNDTIYINSRGTNPAAQIFAHEMTHSVEGTDSYGGLSKMVLDYMAQQGNDLDAMREARRKAYGRSDANFDVDAELVAEFVETKLLTDEAEIRKVAASRPSLARAILEKINSFIAKLPFAKGAKERDFLIHARDMYSRALKEAQARSDKYSEADTERAGTQFERFSISETLEEDLEKVKNNTFDSASGEVYIGESSNFLTDVIGAESLSVTMPASKAFSAIVSKEEALSDSRYDAKTNYHGLGVGGLVKALVASETPVAAFVSKPGDKGSRFDRIVLVTDEMLNGDALVVVEEVSTSARLEKRRIKANKVITSYDRESAMSDVIDAINSGRLLYVDKEKSSRLFAGRPGSNSLAAIQKAELNKNIQNFWANVNWKKSGKTSQVFDDGAQAKTEMAYAFEKAKDKNVQFSIPSEPAEQTEPTEQTERTEEKEKPRAFAQYPKKAQRTIKQAEKYLLNGISNLLGVPAVSDREELQKVVSTATDAYLSEGRVPTERATELFGKAWTAGEKIAKDFYNKYKGVADYLRKTPVLLEEKYHKALGNYQEFRESAKGYLNMSQATNRDIKDIYAELSKKAPELFPDNITHPASQLRQMYAVAVGIAKAKQSAERTQSADADSYKAWAREQFRTDIDDYVGELNSAKRYADAEAAKRIKPEQTLTVEGVKGLYKQLKPLKRELEKVTAKNLLTDADRLQVGRLLRGDILLKHLDPETDNVKGITEVYEAALKCEEITNQINEYRQNAKAAKRVVAQELVGDTQQWEDRLTGIMFDRETPERNIRKVVKNSEQAEALIKAYITPIHEHEADANRFKTDYRNRVDALKLSRKINKGDAVSESYAVQLLGEAEDCIAYLKQAMRSVPANKRDKLQRGGKSLADWQAVVENLFIENPSLDEAKIRNAVEEFRAIYDELFEQMNDVRIRNGYEPVSYRRGYFPHFQASDPDGLLATFGKALGITTDIVALPTTINGLTHTFKPGIRWFGNALERVGFETTYDAVQGFDKYIEGVADVIHHTDDIQNLRALSGWIRYAASDAGIKEQENAILADPNRSEEDKELAKQELYRDGKYRLSKFVNWLEEYTNLLANKKSRSDRDLENALNRNIYNAAKNLESRVAANMVSINIGSWLTNFIPITQAAAGIKTKYLLKGMVKTLAAVKNNDGIVGRSAFLTNRRGSDPLVQTWAQKTSAVLSKGMDIVDSFTSDTIVRARYYENLSKGMSEEAALSDADAFAASVIADRSKGAMPTLFQQKNPITKLFTQFQLEVNNQLSYLFRDIPREMRDKGIAAFAMALLKFMVGAWLYNEAYEFLIGRRPALDILNILNETVGDITGWEIPNLIDIGRAAAKGEKISLESERETFGGTIANLGENIFEQVPFTSILNLAGMDIDAGRVAISSAVPNFGKIADAFEKGVSGKKRLQTLAKELGKPAAYILPPFGGGQIKKIVEGITAVSRGGSYTVDKDGNDILQYPIYRDTTNQAYKAALGAAIFGKSSLRTGREWVESGFKSLSAKDTALYQALTDLGVGEEKAYDFIKEFKAIEKTDTESELTLQRKFLAESDLSDRAKTVVYYSLLASNSEKDALKPILEDDKKMTDTTKKVLKFYKVDPENEKALAMVEAGLTAEQYIAIRDEYRRLDGADLTAQGKASQFSSWLNNQNLTAEQKVIIKENFKYYSFVKQEAERYDAFIKAGISDKVASDLDNAIRELEPLEGKSTVSAVQKWNVAVSKVTDEKQLQGALEALMSDDQYAAYKDVIEKAGIPSAMYVKGKTLLSEYGSSPSNEEITWAIQDMASNKLELPAVGKTKGTLTDKQRAILWQLWTGSTSTKNNPWAKTKEIRDVVQPIADEAKTKAEESKKKREAEAEAQRKAREK